MASVDEDRAEIEKAIRQHKRGNGKSRGKTDDALGWRELLIKGAKGPRALLANAITAFRYAPEWFGLLQFDSFHQATVLHGKAPWMKQPVDRQVWTALQDVLATNWLQHQGIHVSPDITTRAIETVARDLCFHPVRDYLGAHDWDGVKRLDRWAIKYLGGEDTLYNRTVGARWMISAVARVCQPGAKADCAIILEGRQGLLKSTVIRVLAHPWFTDELCDMGTKDAALQLAGVWIVELAELDSITSAEISRIKSFMSRRVDRFRPPYARRVEAFPRQCVFAGSVNETQYLRDPTGGRRFWPIACGKIHIDSLTKARDQLWAEARSRYLASEAWWLDTDELDALARTEQLLRLQPDAWEKPIAEYLVGRVSVTQAEVLSHLGFTDKDKNQVHMNRVAQCLMTFGWKSKNKRLPGDKWQRRYEPE
jgi:predicted P-loop ATPase